MIYLLIRRIDTADTKYDRQQPLEMIDKFLELKNKFVQNQRRLVFHKNRLQSDTFSRAEVASKLCFQLLSRNIDNRAQNETIVPSNSEDQEMYDSLQKYLLLTLLSGQQSNTNTTPKEIFSAVNNMLRLDSSNKI